MIWRSLCTLWAGHGAVAPLPCPQPVPPPVAHFFLHAARKKKEWPGIKKELVITAHADLEIHRKRRSGNAFGAPTRTSSHLPPPAHPKTRDQGGPLPATILYLTKRHHRHYVMITYKLRRTHATFTPQQRRTIPDLRLPQLQARIRRPRLQPTALPALRTRYPPQPRPRHRSQPHQTNARLLRQLCNTRKPHGHTDNVPLRPPTPRLDKTTQGVSPMPYRASLTKCIGAAADRLHCGQSDYIIITRNAANKYYTLYHPCEYESRLRNKPLDRDQIVLCCTGGELASIIAAACTQLKLLET